MPTKLPDSGKQIPVRFDLIEVRSLFVMAEKCGLPESTFIRELIRAIARSVLDDAEKSEVGIPRRFPVSDTVIDLLNRYDAENKKNEHLTSNGNATVPSSHPLPQPNLEAVEQANKSKEKKKIEDEAEGRTQKAMRR